MLDVTEPTNGSDALPCSMLQDLSFSEYQEIGLKQELRGPVHL